MKEQAYREKEWWEHYPLHKLWCNDLCPLVPRFHYRKGDKYNTNRWSVHWLIFNVWLMDHFSFGVDAGISITEFYVGAILPYLRIVVGIRNVYSEWSWKLTQLLTRKPTIKNPDSESTDHP